MSEWNLMIPNNENLLNCFPCSLPESKVFILKWIDAYFVSFADFKLCVLYEMLLCSNCTLILITLDIIAGITKCVDNK